MPEPKDALPDDILMPTELAPVAKDEGTDTQTDIAVHGDAARRALNVSERGAMSPSRAVCGARWTPFVARSLRERNAGAAAACETRADPAVHGGGIGEPRT